MTRVLLFSLLLVSLPVVAVADEGPTSQPRKRTAIDTTVADLELVDIRYLPRKMSELGDSQATVLFFTNLDCPLVKRYLPRVVRMAEAYRARGVQFVAVNVGPDDTIIDMASQMLEAGAGFPFLKDFDGTSLGALGVERTATVVVLDADQRLRYRGRVDDQYRFGGVRPKATRADLREAIEDVLAKKPVRTPETAVDGCRVAPPTPKVPKVTPTWARDVAPIFRKSCVSCHRPGVEAAPFSLLKYEKAAANAEMIAEVVRQGRMPPWFASPKHGKWVNERRLTRAEKDTVVAWARAGAPRGDESILPPAPKLDDPTWEIGEPDLVLTAPTEAKLPADGYVRYQYVLLPYTFPADTWVTGVQIKPRNRRVLHHANLAYLFADNPRKSWFITGQVPGGEAMKLPEGQGFLIPKGATLVIQIHYVTTGKPEVDRISVGLRYSRWRIKKRLHHIQVNNRRFAIPPGAAAHKVRASKKLPHNADALALFSHMHLRGRDMTFKVVYPDGRRETLLSIPNYNFDWQLAYSWKPGTKRLPKGTRLVCVGHFDNSVFNPYNPDPQKTVRFGAQTYHEMFYGFFFYTDADETLDLEIDPRTGRAVPPAKKQSKRFFK